MQSSWANIQSAVNADPREGNTNWQVFDPEPEKSGFRCWAGGVRKEISCGRLHRSINAARRCAARIVRNHERQERARKALNEYRSQILTKPEMKGWR